MPTPYEKLDFKTLFHNQAAYERIDSVGKKLHPKWNIVEFEKTLFGAGENHFFKAGQEEVLKAELSDLNDAMPFLKFGEEGQHYAYALFLSDPDRGWGARGMPFLWAYMARQFTSDKLPMSETAITEKARVILHSLGISEVCEESIYIERFAAGGMSSGHVNGKYFWECFLPIILRRSKLYK